MDAMLITLFYLVRKRRTKYKDISILLHKKSLIIVDFFYNDIISILGKRRGVYA